MARARTADPERGPESRDGADRMRVSASAVLVVIGAALAWATFSFGLNGDVTYVLGGIEVRGGGPAAAVGTFVHRPILYRLALGLLDGAAGMLGLHPDRQVAYEAVIRLLTDAAVVLVGWLLYRALAPRLGKIEAAAAAVAVGVALIAAPAWDYLQPEWLASLLVVAAVGAALLPRSGTVAGLLGGGLLVAAVAAKIATAPYAALGVAVVLLVDRRRAMAVTGGGLLWGVIGLGALVVMPQERQWVSDMVALNANSPMRAGLTLDDLLALVRGLASKAALNPAVLALPATTVLLVATIRGRRRRIGVTLLIVTCVALALATAVAQGVYYLYHYAILPVLATGIGAVALARWLPRVRYVAVAGAGGLGLAGLATTMVLVRGPAWRTANHLAVEWVLLAIAIVGAGISLALVGLAAHAARADAGRDAGRRSLPAWAVALVISGVCVAPGVLPASAWSLDPQQTGATNRSWIDRSRAAVVTLGGLSDQIGRETPVLYLAYGTVAYEMGNPTDCAYPSPLFLRTSGRPYVLSMVSFADNARCLESDVPRWLILQPGWLNPATLPAALRAALEERYDCSAGRTVGGVTACPRREAGTGASAPRDNRAVPTPAGQLPKVPPLG